MPNSKFTTESSFRWGTAAKVAAIVAVLFFTLGAYIAQSSEPQQCTPMQSAVFTTTER